MVRLSKTFFLLLALMGTLCACTTHRELEENSSEAEETEIELLISRRNDCGRTKKSKLSPLVSIAMPGLAQHGLSQNISRAHFVVRPQRERDEFNGIGAFLLI